MHLPNPRRRITSVLVVLSLIATLLGLGATGTASAQPTPTTFVNPGPLATDVGQPMCVDLVVGGSGTLEVTAVTPLPVGITVGEPTPGEFVLQGTAVSTGTSSVTLRATADGGTVDQTFTLTRFVPAASDPVIKAGRLDIGFTIDCRAQHGVPTNQFLSSPLNFGPSGTVRLPRGLVVAPHVARITAAYLADADVLFDGWVRSGTGGYSQAELRLIEQWVNDGGVLVSTNDQPGSDPLARLFGEETAGNERHCTDPLGPGDEPDPPCRPFTPHRSAGDHPIVSGPFGRWTSLAPAGTVGWFATPSRGWNIVAVDRRNNPTVMERRVGNGHVILLSDEGIMRHALSGDNGRFLGNLMAFALDQISLVPKPANDVLVGRLFRPFRADLCANDVKGDGRQRVRITEGSVPPGLRLNRCILSGTPSLPAFGTHSFAYRLTDADGDSNTALVQVTLNGINPHESNPRCQGRPASIVGTRGGDVIIGTNGDDVIVAGNGNDVIDGRGGNDLICGGRGRDTISGGNGRDICDGGPGRDRLDRTCESRRGRR